MSHLINAAATRRLSPSKIQETRLTFLKFYVAFFWAIYGPKRSLLCPLAAIVNFSKAQILWASISLTFLSLVHQFAHHHVPTGGNTGKSYPASLPSKPSNFLYHSPTSIKMILCSFFFYTPTLQKNFLCMVYYYYLILL